MLLLSAIWLVVDRLPRSKQCLPVGVSSNYQYSGTRRNLTLDLPRLKKAGIESIREDVLWEVVQREGPADWNWVAYDELFTSAAKMHLHVLPIVGYGTAWATKTVLDMPTSTIGQYYYARFAAAIVERYGPGGKFWRLYPTLPPAAVDAVELWNEPWTRSAARADSYVRLIDIAGAAVHKIAPRVSVVVNVDDRRVHGAPASSAPWGAQVLIHADKLKKVVNRWAIHPYARYDPQNPAADSTAQVSWLQKLLAHDHIGGDVWVTEIGFDRYANHANLHSFGIFLTAMRRHRGPNAVTAIWIFTAARPSPSTKPGSFDYGFNLVSADGKLSDYLPDVNTARCGEL